jgi:hypothetical protein
VLGQLGNRVQHALRAFTPKDQKAVKSCGRDHAAEGRSSTSAQAITELSVGEALVSLLDAKGRPCVVERAYRAAAGLAPSAPSWRPSAPRCCRTPWSPGVYEKALDRQSAYEMLKGQAAAPSGKAGSGMADEGGAVFRQQPTSPQVEPEGGGVMDGLKDVLFGSTGPRGGRREGLAETAAKSALRSIGSSVGREIVRGVLGSLLGGGSSRRRR